MPETLEHARARAHSLLTAGKAVEAICVMAHCLNGLGVSLPLITWRLGDLKDASTVADVRQWVAELEP